MVKKLILVGALLLCCSGLPLFSQVTVEQLMKEQDQLNQEETTPVSSTFESTRLILGHSVESSKAGNLDFRISHRFASVDEGFYNLFGLDYANIRFGFDYGITDRLMVGLGRSSLDKEYDLYGKYKLLQQTTGKKTMPVSLSVMGEMMVKTQKSLDGTSSAFEDKMSSAMQILLARKFSGYFSAQLVPTWIHYAKTPVFGDPNDIFTVGVGGSFRLTKRIRLNAEYYPLFGDNKLSGTVSPFSIGFDMETGGHVFQLFVSNSMGTDERLFITQTLNKWDEGKIHIGFNILRVFSLKKKNVSKN